VASGRYVFEVATGRVASQYSDGKGNNVNKLAVSSDSRLLVRTSFSGNTAQVLEATTGKEILSVSQRGRVQAVTFSPDSRWLALGGDERVARVVEVTTGKELLRFIYPGRVLNIAFSSDARYLYVLSDTLPPSFGFIGSARGLWLHKQFLDTDELIHEVCSRLTSNLTLAQWNEYLGGAPYRNTCPSLRQPPK
jgi:WD40 repeat protein